MPTELDFGPFLALPEEARVALAARARPVRVARAEHVVRAGEPPDAAYAVLAGRVRVTGEDGTVLSTMAAPSLVGELSVLEGRPRSADVVALEPARALRIDAADLREVASVHDGFARTMEAFADARRANAFLRRAGPFTELPSGELEELAARMRPRHAVAGEVLMREGELADDVLLVQVGELEAVRLDAGGERVLSRLGPGSLVGEIAALTGSPRTATVRARTDADTLVIDGDDVRRVVKRHRALLGRVTSVMQARHAPRRTGQHTVEPAPDDPDAVILQDPERGAFLRLDRQAHAIYRDLDGDRSLRDLSLLHFERTGKLDPQAVFSTVAALQASGFATAPRTATDTAPGRLLRAADVVLSPRLEVADADRVATALHRALAPLFTRPAAIAAAALGIVGLVVAIPVLRTASPSEFGLAGIVVAFAGLLVAGIGHEAAHALAAKAEGTRIGRAGIGLFWFTPVVYVDTSLCWAIPRWARIRVNAAGPLFNLALAGLFALLARVSSGRTEDVLVWLALTNVVLVVFNLSPLLEFDGYYVLADLTDTNALRRKALRAVFRDIGHPRRPASRREAGYLAYTAAAIVYVLAMSAVAIVGATTAVHAFLPSWVGASERTAIGVAVGAVVAVMLVMPFAAEALAARRWKEAGSA